MAGIRLQEEMSGSHAPGKVLHLRPPIRRDPPHAEDVALSPRVAGAGQRMSRAARDFPRPAISPATVSGIEQALRERDQLTLAPFGTPRHAAVRQDAHDHATGGAPECLHAIAWFEIHEGIAVEEEERSAAMALPQEIYGLVEGKDLSLLCCPLACARCLSLSIKAVLRASSCARSSVEADDKLQTPVFEKFGSGL